MPSSQSVLWHHRPARPFPAQCWVRQRYGFTFPSLFFAQPPHAISTGLVRRPFPAKVWLEARQAGG